MKTFIISLLICLLSIHIINAQTTQWVSDNAHTKIGFSISHFGISEVEGRFTKFDGSVLSDKPDFSDAKIEFFIDAGSIDTEQSQRDTHLKSPDFFDVAKYPSITFKSKSLQSTGKNNYKLTGEIKMHGITKNIELDVLLKGAMVDPDKNIRAGFKISGKLDRTQFGLVWNGKLPSGDFAVGDDVFLAVNLELVKKP